MKNEIRDENKNLHQGGSSILPQEDPSEEGSGAIKKPRFQLPEGEFREERNGGSILDIYEEKKTPTVPSSQLWNDILPTPTTSFFRGSSLKRKYWSLAAWSSLAFILDTGFAIGSGLLLFVLTSFLWSKLLSLDLLQSYSIQMISNEFWMMYHLHKWEWAIGYFSVHLLTYLLWVRILLGYSFGEWACRIRLGPPEKFEQDFFYGLRVLYRMSLMLLTGGILPLIGLIIGKDLIGEISKISLCERTSQEPRTRTSK